MMQGGIKRELLEGKKYFTDLLIVIFLGLLSTVAILVLPEGSVLRAVLGIPMLVILPGYSLVSVLWPANSGPVTGGTGSKQTEFGIPERIIIGIGLSLVLVSLLGIILAYGLEMNMVSIILPLLVITLVLSFGAVYLRTKLPESERFAISFLPQESADSTDRGADKVFFAILTAAIVVFSGVAVYMISAPNDEDLSPSFYMEDSNGLLPTLPLNLTVNQAGNMTVGVIHRGTSAEYTLVAGIGDSNQTVQYYPPTVFIRLNSAYSLGTNFSFTKPGNFEQVYEFSFPAPGQYTVVWSLLIDGQETEYRLHMKVNVI